MRIPLIAGNWKMFKTVHEAVVFAKELRSIVKDVPDVEIVVGPPFTAVHAGAEALRSTNVAGAGPNPYLGGGGAFPGGGFGAGVKKGGGANGVHGGFRR